MIGGLIYKSLRETWVMTAVLGFALLAVKALITFVLPQISGQITDLMTQMPFVQTMLGALLGVDTSNGLTAQMMQSILWVHPVVLALMWAHEMIYTTRVPCGEVDRGTIDFLLGLPVSRRRVYLAETIAWLGSGLVLLCMAVAGHLIGLGAIAPDLRPDVVQVGLILLNMFGLYVAVGGVCLMISTLCDRRGRAIGIILGIVLASFLLNFLAQFWAPAQNVVFLSVLEYYQPAAILGSSRVPVTDLLVLYGVGLVTWIAGAEIIARRSLCTV